jgi:uncharacterized protein (TIGR02588 family)
MTSVKTTSRQSLGKNWLEWCVFGLGSVLVLSTIGYLVYEASVATDTPTNLEVQLGKAEPRGERFALPVVVANRGDGPAETIRVAVDLTTADGSEERAVLELQLLPGGGTRRGWVMLENDPAQAAELTGRAMSYEEP